MHKNNITTILLVFINFCFSQTTIEGKVYDINTKEPLESVSIYIENTHYGTVTNSEGKYQFTFKAETPIITFSYLGYETKSIPSLEIPKQLFLSEHENVLEEVLITNNKVGDILKDVLKTKRDKEDVKLKGIYNPMEDFFRKGLGSNAYRDAWSLFDQILITKPLLDTDYSSFRFYKAGVFNKQYLTNKKGRYKGYPFRSFADGGFTNGFSDHFPVYVHVIKEVK